MRQPHRRILPKAEHFSATLDSLISNLVNTGRGRKQALSILMDGILVVGALWLSYTLRLGESFSDFASTWYLFALLPAITVGIFSGLGIYRWVIRSSNQRLFRQLVKGSILSALALLLMFFVLPPERSNPRSILVIYVMSVLLSTIGIRVIWRSLCASDQKGEPVTIYGAGSAGQQLANLLRVGGEYRPVAFIDDDIALCGSTISGLPVFHGADATLKSKLQKFDTVSIVLAIPSLSAKHYQAKLHDLDALPFRIQTMPSVSELMSGKARADDIRDVSVSDILGRNEVMPDLELMARRVTGKTILVTGGGGSIGSELCRQIENLAPARLIILDNCEANLYHINEELKGLFLSQGSSEQAALVSILGSVTDSRHIEHIMSTYQVNTVFHAAAYKHVPIVESQPEQGVMVNVFGTLTVLDAAIRCGVSDFTLISTDKAVRPTNAMGASKRVAELVLQAKARIQDTTRISMVRFGNVLGSSGSVVPKFKKQIRQGGPITLTHTDITRYFMTIPEAAQLVLQASAIAQGGDVFVLDMGEPVRIEELATTMVRLYGRKLQRDTGNPDDIAIVVEGLRPGEKMYEELFLSESVSQSVVQKISSADEAWIAWTELTGTLDHLQDLVKTMDSDAVRDCVLELAYAAQAEPFDLHNQAAAATAR